MHVANYKCLEVFEKIYVYMAVYDYILIKFIHTGPVCA